MSNGWKIFLAILVCVCIIATVLALGAKEAEVNHSAFREPGICPNCGAKLVKGVYGEVAPIFIWYCPDCP